MKDWRFLYEKYVLRQHGPKGFPEPEVLRIVRNIHGKLFVDVGANMGIYSVRLAKNFEKIYCFEPNPEIKSLLIQNLSRMRGGKYTLFPIALSNMIGTTTFYRDPHKGFTGSADTILQVFEYRPARTGFPDNAYIGREGITIETDTYDNQVKETADLVKVDVEGAEFLVLEGMRESLKQNRIRRIVVELHDRRRRTELELLLTNNGFITGWIDPDHVLGELEAFTGEYRTL